MDFSATAITPNFWGNRLTSKLSFAQLNQAKQSGPHHCSVAVVLQVQEVAGPEAALLHDASLHHHLHLVFEGELSHLIIAARCSACLRREKSWRHKHLKFIWIFWDLLWLQLPSLTRQRVHVSLGVVEESSVTTHQVKSINQVRTTQVLRRGHGLRARAGYDHEEQHRERLEPQSRHTGRQMEKTRVRVWINEIYARNTPLTLAEWDNPLRTGEVEQDKFRFQVGIQWNVKIPEKDE